MIFSNEEQIFAKDLHDRILDDRALMEDIYSMDGIDGSYAQLITGTLKFAKSVLSTNPGATPDDISDAALITGVKNSMQSTKGGSLGL